MSDDEQVLHDFVGKFVVGYMPVCGEKEYYLACACGELYAPPSAYVALFGLTVQQTFLRGNCMYYDDTKLMFHRCGYWLNTNLFYVSFLAGERNFTISSIVMVQLNYIAIPMIAYT